MTRYMTEQEYIRALYHWGIPGMKWYQRRFQNKDGTLTEAGKKRYYKTDGSLTRRGEKWKANYTKQELVKTRQSERAAAKTMTIEELKQKTDRLRLEQEYLKYFPEIKDSPKLSDKVKASLGKVMRESFETGAKNAGSKIVEYSMLNIADKAFSKSTGDDHSVTGFFKNKGDNNKKKEKAENKTNSASDNKPSTDKPNNDSGNKNNKPQKENPWDNKDEWYDPDVWNRSLLEYDSNNRKRKRNTDNKTDNSNRRSVEVPDNVRNAMKKEMKNRDSRNKDAIDFYIPESTLNIDLDDHAYVLSNGWDSIFDNDYPDS